MAAGAFTELDGDWRGTTRMCSVGNKTFVFDNGIFYSLSADGAFQELSNDWQPTVVVGTNDAVFVFDERGTLYKVNPADGTNQSLDGDWSGTQAAAFNGTHLMVVCKGVLYRVDI